ncbi:MAG: tetratricopeptide repeat protein [Tahibacter sp.]
MSDPHWQRLQELFEALLELPPDTRESWLADQSDPDDLKQRALTLARADAQVHNGITRQIGVLAESLATAPASGLMLGAYRLLREIGSGGMGTVFLAERADAEFDRQVAIKLIRGIPTRDAHERLRRERQILAKLEHPHIARLLDGGTSSDGQPYLVMELVDGAPITRWCREQRLALTARVDLLRKVCLAVQYAHQRLVIHRDLKPANVLVRADGEPVLLDFGIAKLLDPDHSGPAEATGAQFYTPNWASPEQRRGEAASTASDVYALGLLLYELVYDVAPAPQPDGRLGVPVHDAAGRPVPRDLQLILARATHVEAARRYASAETLAEDLRRWQRGRAVLAAPDSVAYRSSKFIRRHPIAIGLGLLGLALILAATWRTARERDRALRAEATAQQESTAARNVSDYLVSLFEAADPDQNGKRQLSPRELVDMGKNQLNGRFGDDPAQRGRLLLSLGRVYRKLGLPADAATTLGDAVQALRGSSASADLPHALEELGNAHRDNTDFEPALKALQEAADLSSVGIPDGAEALRIRAELALVQSRSEQTEPAIAGLQRVLAAYATHATTGDTEDRANARLFLAEALLNADRLDESLAAAQEALTMLRKNRPADDPVVVAAMGFLANVLRAKGQFSDAEGVLKDMLALRLARYDANSDSVALVRNELAIVYHGQGRIMEAREQMELSLASARVNLGEDNLSYAVSLNNLASMHEELGDYAKADGMLRQALSIAEKHASEDAAAVILYRQNLGRLLMLSGRLDEAWPLLSHPIGSDGDDSSNIALQRARQLFHLGEWFRRKHDLVQAQSYFDQADTALKPVAPAESPRFAQLARSRALLAAERGDTAVAIAGLREAVRMLLAARGQTYPGTAEAQVELAELLDKTGATTEAQTLFDLAAPPLMAQMADAAPARAKLERLRDALHIDDTTGGRKHD